MKTTALVIFLTVGGAALACQSANALVEVRGEGSAHACFMAVEARQAPNVGIAICNKALSEERISDRASTLVNRGVFEFAKGQTDEALADFEAGIKLMPELGDAYADRGVLMISLHRYDEALADISKGIALGLSRPHLGYYNRATAEESLGKNLDAYHDFKHVLDLEPSYTQASEQLKRYKVTITPVAR